MAGSFLGLTSSVLARLSLFIPACVYLGQKQSLWQRHETVVGHERESGEEDSAGPEGTRYLQARRPARAKGAGRGPRGAGGRVESRPRPPGFSRARAHRRGGGTGSPARVRSEPPGSPGARARLSPRSLCSVRQPLPHRSRRKTSSRITTGTSPWEVSRLGARWGGNMNRQRGDPKFRHGGEGEAMHWTGLLPREPGGGPRTPALAARAGSAGRAGGGAGRGAAGGPGLPVAGRPSTPPSPRERHRAPGDSSRPPRPRSGGLFCPGEP